MKNRPAAEPTPKPSSESAAPNGRRLVVINHHEARVFRSVNVGTIPEHILSRGSAETSGDAPTPKDFSRGGEKPSPHRFFPPVAEALKDAGEILVFGSGTGMANEMNQFVTWLETHHTPIAQRVIGAVTIDEHHLTQAQLLAKARDFFALPRRTVAVTF